MTDQEIKKLTDIGNLIPQNYRGLYLRVVTGKASPRQVIKLKCAECCGFEDTKTRISECSVFRCPLRFLRPYQGDTPNYLPDQATHAVKISRTGNTANLSKAQETRKASKENL